MNTFHTVTKFATAARIVGILMVLTALSLGALLGQSANPITPASAVTPTEMSTCALSCLDGRVGIVGNTAPGLNISQPAGGIGTR